MLERLQDLEGEYDAVEAQLADLEEERLFSGDYDSGDALVTVNAGAGGTDAQDWAEMVLRMLMRWTISAQSWASVPPAPALTVTRASPES